MLKNFLDNYPFGKISKETEEAIAFLTKKLSTSSIQIPRQQAYVLATIKHETADQYTPVVEGYWLRANRIKKLWDYYKEHNPNALKSIFPEGRDGVNYLGRGFVQITHDYNYRTFSNLLKIDLLHNPDLALDPEIAWKIVEFGMVRGLFTGKKLSDYFNEKTDFYHARQIINGMDRALEISEIAQKIYRDINQIKNKDIPPIRDYDIPPKSAS